ncbi:MAG: hypothetical protein K6F44_03970 [Lachnospiraceae bacterium]|nr:hypothetical protein [Lachnospiraceae bacterium]
MDEERTLILGMDLCDGSLQLAYIDERGDMVSVSPFTKDVGKYRIPTAICTDRQYKEWYCGQDAQRLKDREGIVYFDDLLSKVANDDGEPALGGLTPTALLTHYFRIVLTALRERTGGQIIKGLTVTIKQEDIAAEHAVKEAFAQLGIESDRLSVITHSEAFANYVISQNKDIWINDVGLFYMSEDAFDFYRLTFGRKQGPTCIVTEKTDLSSYVSGASVIGGDMTNAITGFKEAVSKMINKQMVSALYFTGPGFESSWADEVLKGLCTGRRIFRGQNLYVKGAGYKARRSFAPAENEEEYVYIAPDALKSSISLRAYKDGGYEEAILADIGTPYLRASKKVEVIMDGTNELDLIVHNVLKKDFVCAIMTLDNMEERTDRSGKVSITLNFADRDTCVITVRDVGFGEIRDTTYRIWEQILKI